MEQPEVMVQKVWDDLLAKRAAKETELKEVDKELESFKMKVAKTVGLVETPLEGRLVLSTVIEFMKRNKKWMTAQDVWKGVGSIGDRLAFSGRMGPMVALSSKGILERRTINGKNMYRWKEAS